MDLVLTQEMKDVCLGLLHAVPAVVSRALPISVTGQLPESHSCMFTLLPASVPVPCQVVRCNDERYVALHCALAFPSIVTDS